MSNRYAGQDAVDFLNAQTPVKKPPEEMRLSSVFENSRKLNAPDKPIPTGFFELDEALGGGLVPQLYVLGAESGTGKSTFMLNIAENIARAEKPVMYFSLEMPRDYIARLIICHCMFVREDGGRADFDAEFAVRNFMNNDGLKKLRRNREFKPAFEKYRELGEHFYVFERDRQSPRFNANDIYDSVAEFKKQNKKLTPVVIVDYLQILDAGDDKYSLDQRAVVDFNVGILTRITAELEVPVIAISALNRAANKANRDIEMSDFKESGRIEYSADVLLALKYKTGKESKDGIQQRTLKLSILKNRYGEKDMDESSGRWLLFYPQFGYFERGEKPADAELKAEKSKSKSKSKSASESGTAKTDSAEPSTESRKTKKQGSAVKWILNSRIANSLRESPDNCGTPRTLVISKQGESPESTITYLLRKKSGEETVGADSLNLWDLAVLDAVYAVTNRGEKSTFTITELHKFMCGKSQASRRSEKLTERYTAALDRLKNRELIIDITEERQMRSEQLSKDKSWQRAVERTLAAHPITPDDKASLPAGFNRGGSIIKGTLLPFETDESGKIYRLIDSDRPILFDYTENISRQYMKYDPMLWGHFDSDSDSDNSDSETQSRFTSPKLLIRYYLIHRISVIKFNPTLSHKIIIYSSAMERDKEKDKEALFPLLVLAGSIESIKPGESENLKNHGRFNRWLANVREYTEMILEDFKKQRFISEYYVEAEGKDKVAYNIKLPRRTKE